MFAETQDFPRLDRILQIAWIALAIVTLAIMVMAVPARYRNLSAVSDTSTSIGDLTLQDRAALEELGLSVHYYALHFTGLESLSAVVFFALSALLFWKGRREHSALVVALMLMGFGANASPIYDALIQEQSHLSTAVTVFRAIGLTGVVFIFFVFPDGHFVPRWTRWLVPVWMVYVLLWTVSPDLKPVVRIVFSSPSDLINFLVLLGFLGSGATALLYRYRVVSTPLQRQQIRLVIFSGLIALLVTSSVAAPIIAMPIFKESGPIAMLGKSVAFTMILVSQIGLAISTAIAILKYRMYDIEFIIRRTFTYTAITALLAAVYIGAVTLLQSLFAGLIGSESPLAIVISTLTIAVLFNPLRKRVQVFVDRRFYRQKYDAEQTLEQFSQTMRDEVDLDRMTVELVETVEATIHPESVSLWLNSEQL